MSAAVAGTSEIAARRDVRYFSSAKPLLPNYTYFWLYKQFESLSEPDKISLLVIPDLFPKNKDDVQGIFVLDYLKAIEPFCKVTVLFVRVSGLPKGLTVETSDNITVYKYGLSSGKVSKLLKAFYYLQWFAKAYSLGKNISGIQCIHAHGTILSGTVSHWLSRKKKIPFVITEHLGPFSVVTNSPWKWRWTKRIMEKADAVLTVSGHLKQEILDSGIRPASLQVTYNPVDTTLFALKKNTNTHNILFAGRLDPFKGALRCLKAFGEVAVANPGWTLTIAGDGEEMPALKAYLEERPHLQARVRLKGHMLKGGLAAEMQRADFFVFPSRHESFGLVVAEAMACGLPVIVGNLTAPKEYVNAQSGLLVPPDDIDAIAAAIQQMIGEAGSYSAETIRAQVEERFGFENFGKKLVSVYRSFL